MPSERKYNISSVDIDNYKDHYLFGVPAVCIEVIRTVDPKAIIIGYEEQSANPVTIVFSSPEARGRAEDAMRGSI